MTPDGPVALTASCRSYDFCRPVEPPSTVTVNAHQPFLTYGMHQKLVGEATAAEAEVPVVTEPEGSIQRSRLPHKNRRWRPISRDDWPSVPDVPLSVANWHVLRFGP